MPRQSSSGNIGANYQSAYKNTYNSISGVDIKCTIGGVTFGNLQAISYSVTREKAPLHTMGSPDPRGYARGKRGIAGSLVFLMFDEDALLGTMRALAASRPEEFGFVSDNDESRPYLETATQTEIANGTANNGSAGLRVLANQNSSNTSQQVLFNATNREAPLTGGKLSNGWTRVAPWYNDQIPAFNIVLTGVNEEGFGAIMALLGVEILNEGYGISIDDIVSEQQMTFVARAKAPWQRIYDEALLPGNNTKWYIPTYGATNLANPATTT